MNLNKNKEIKNPTVGNVFSLGFLGLTSVAFAYAPNGFDNATMINHVFAVLTFISTVNLFIKLG